MEKNEFKKVCIKNRTCYYVDDIIKLEDFDIDKTLTGAKPFRIRSHKIEGFIRIYDGTRHLILLGSEKYDAIYNRIRYLIGLKGSITYAFFHDYAKIKVDCYYSLLIEKRFSLYNGIILIKSVFNEDKNRYYYYIFSEKCFHQLAKKQSQKLFL